MRTHSTCSQSAPFLMVVEQSAPRAAKSAERIDGAMMAGGDIAAEIGGKIVKFWRHKKAIAD